MATKLATEHKVIRADVLRVHPDDVVLGRNSRIVEAVDQKDRVHAKALSILDQGQLEPCLAHRNAENKIVLDAGFTRYAAVQLIRTGFDGVDPTDGQKRFFQDAAATLDVIVDTSVKTEEEAFLRSITENASRDDTTDIQEAEAQRVLREEFKFTDARIARHYGYSNTNRIAALKTLLTLEQEVIDLVHAGRLSVSAALDTQTLTGEQRKQVLQKAQDDTGKVDGAQVRRLVRDVYSAGDAEAKGGTPKTEEPKGTPTPKTPAANVFKWTVKDFQKFSEEVADPVTVVSDHVREVFEVLSRLFKGELKTEKKLWEALAKIK